MLKYQAEANPKEEEFLSLENQQLKIQIKKLEK